MSSYLDRDGATAFLRDAGVLLGKSTLQNMAGDGKGPRYVIINGRALYTREDLTAWIKDQASVPPRRRTKAAQGDSPQAA
jgi:hypothetical protein